MPIQAFNLSRQRSTKSAITVNGLLTWRARRLRSLRLEPDSRDQHLADIAAIDRVLVNLIGFTGYIEARTRDFTREALFRRGELQRLVATVLREANGPLTARQITERVMSAKGHAMQPGKKSVHLRVDADVLAWFKAQGRGYLTRMNAVLRSYMEAYRQDRP